MALTREFKQTVRARAQRDAAFRKELLREAVENFLAGDVETGKAILRDYINATIGFQELADMTNHSPKSLMRMLSPSGNPQAKNLFEILSALQGKARVQFRLKTFQNAAGA
jgi:DNA-binding phage protein